MVLCDPSSPVSVTSRFLARVVVFNIDIPITKGDTFCVNCASGIVPFFSRPSPKAGRELQTVFDTRMMKDGGGPLAEPEPVTGP